MMISFGGLIQGAGGAAARGAMKRGAAFSAIVFGALCWLARGAKCARTATALVHQVNKRTISATVTLGRYSTSTSQTFNSYEQKEAKYTPKCMCLAVSFYVKKKSFRCLVILENGLYSSVACGATAHLDNRGSPKHMCFPSGIYFKSHIQRVRR